MFSFESNWQIASTSLANPNGWRQRLQSVFLNGLVNHLSACFTPGGSVCGGGAWGKSPWRGLGAWRWSRTAAHASTGGLTLASITWHFIGKGQIRSTDSPERAQPISNCLPGFVVFDSKSLMHFCYKVVPPCFHVIPIHSYENS